MFVGTRLKNVLYKFVVLACALYLSGAHWMVLQVTAWTGMIMTRAPQAGMSVAMETTFDGKHPCRMCTAVADGQKEEQQQPASTSFGKVHELKLVAIERCELPQPIVTGVMEWPERITGPERCMDAPPTPPPLV